MSGVDSICKQLASATVEEDEKNKEVNFAGRGLKLNTEEDAEEIVKAINSCPGMTTLCLEGNTLGIPAAGAIAKALEKQPNFKRALWRDMFTQRTVEEIPQALTSLSNSVMLAHAKLVVLDLSDNAFGPRVLVGLKQFLESSSCYTLQELHLNNNGLGITGAQMLAGSLCKLVENSRKDGSPLSLKIFVCGRNRLENEGATAIAKFFEASKTLESVAMPQNGIYSPGIEQLANAFKSNLNLKVINLEDNSLTEEGAEYIADCLPTLSQIEMLNFGDCLIHTKGAIYLAEALEISCPNLRELYLGFNEINKEGGIALVEAIKGKKMLQMLVLNGNMFGEEGCGMIQSRMQEIDFEDKLGPLSEDEGDDDDEDDEEEDEDYENVEDEESNSENEDPNKSVQVIKEKTHKSPMQKSSPADFFAHPTSDVLIALHETKEDITTVLTPESSASDYLDLFVKVCSVVKPGEEIAKSAACYYADALFPKAIKLCEEKNEDFNDKFLVKLQLIKEEDKKYRTKIDLTGIFLVLQYVVKQAYFLKSTKDFLQFFLARPLAYATVFDKAKHGLLQVLFQV